tara:strand:+ start:179 stop:976 length:798 start_codon:yes stop_codon:yes gene_type:complete
MQGYIKINRAILNHPALNKRDRTFCEVGAWLWLLLEASFAERDFSIGTQTIKLQRGELCHSVSYMAEAWGWTQSKTRHYLDKLVKFNSISFGKSQGKSADFPNTIKIVNYDDYQDGYGKSNGEPRGNKHNKIINKDIIYIDEFNTIWSSLKAKRGSKKVALQKYRNIKNKVDANILIEKYNRIVDKASSPEFIPHFSTYLSQERWEDDDTVVKLPVKSSDEYFRETYPDKVPQGFRMVAETWAEIEYSDGKQYLKFSKRNGNKIK